MTKQALIELRDKVASGTLTQNYCLCSHVHGVPLTATIWEIHEKGSLDAAVAFLEAVLPDWTVNNLYQERFPDNGMKPTGEWRCLLFAAFEDRFSHVDTTADTPARALLLATLEALIARAE